ncbi:DUF2637 domain-containing protein [Streptomyces sp. DT224]|uniref:DUF2637 domain-containing protein n=1 Tax=Streptomyces sp. DT224 TaxID=3393426 RepID=UPI003CE877E5
MLTTLLEDSFVTPPLPTARFATMSESDIRSAERTLIAGTWAITAGALLYSVLTVTPLVRSVSPSGWGWTAPILPLVVDAAVIIVVKLDAVIARLGGKSGTWPVLLRWMTGLMTLALNVGNSALHRDWVGMAVHSVAPLLLIVTAEASLSYRRAITAALTRIAQEQARAAERERAQREAQQRNAREEREQEQARRQEEEQRARDHAAQVERERAQREEARLTAEREHALAVERERTAREQAERAAALEREKAAREFTARMERERAEREASERRRQEQRADEERRERAEREEQERRRAERARQSEHAAAVAPSSGRRVVRAAKAEGTARRVVTAGVVMDSEFAGLTMDKAEAALFELYFAAREASPYEDWEQDPLARPGGEFCGSNLGRRLGRSSTSGRTKVKPKFERWYQEKTAADSRELVGAH